MRVMICLSRKDRKAIVKEAMIGRDRRNDEKKFQFTTSIREVVDRNDVGLVKHWKEGTSS